MSRVDHWFYHPPTGHYRPSKHPKIYRFCVVAEWDFQHEIDDLNQQMWYDMDERAWAEGQSKISGERPKRMKLETWQALNDRWKGVTLEEFSAKMRAIRLAEIEKRREYRSDRFTICFAQDEQEAVEKTRKNIANIKYLTNFTLEPVEHQR